MCQDAASEGQYGQEMAKRWPVWAGTGPMLVQDKPTMGHERVTRSQGGVRTSQDGAKMGLTWGRDGPVAGHFKANLSLSWAKMKPR